MCGTPYPARCAWGTAGAYRAAGRTHHDKLSHECRAIAALAQPTSGAQAALVAAARALGRVGAEEADASKDGRAAVNRDPSADGSVVKLEGRRAGGEARQRSLVAGRVQHHRGGVSAGVARQLQRTHHRAGLRD